MHDDVLLVFWGVQVQKALCNLACNVDFDCVACIVVDEPGQRTACHVLHVNAQGVGIFI